MVRGRIAAGTPFLLGGRGLNGYPYLHDASANKNVHVSNASIAVQIGVARV